MPANVRAAWEELTAGRSRAEDVWAVVARAHGAPGRHYHTIDHLSHLLSTFARHGTGLTPADRRVFVYATMFHDAVYEPRRRDNEARSADLAEAALATLEEPPGVAARVRRWILATAGHARSGEAALDLFLDCDRAIFAAAPDEYERYADAVRREFLDAGFTAAEFLHGRLAFLGRSLERNPFFLTPRFRMLEHTAHDNIRDELRRLARAADL